MAEIDFNLALPDDVSAPTMVDQIVRLTPLAEHVAPLLQTLLWVLVVGVAILLFRKGIQAAVLAVIKRIESGGGIKAGGFELPEFRPQDAQTQKTKFDEEVAAAASPEPAAAPTKPAAASTKPATASTKPATASTKPATASTKPATASTKPATASPEPLPTLKFEANGKLDMPPRLMTQKDLRSTYLQAEDLALRALQSEYKVNIMRQVSAGPGLEFDGVFVFEETIYVVEVKYLRSAGHMRQIRNAMDASIRVHSAMKRNKWPKVRMLIVLVFDSEVNVARIEQAFDEYSLKSPIIVTPRFFSLAELQHKFGLDDD